MMDEKVVDTRVRIVEATASPEALGATLLGWLAVLLSLSSLKVYPLGGMVLAMVFFAGFGFMLVAYMGWKRGELFTLFAFGAIGVFAWAFSALMVMPRMGLSDVPTVNELSAFMIMFAIIVAALGVITLRHPCRLLTITIFFASILFLLVGLQIFIGNDALGSLSGWWGLLVGAMAIYLGCAITLNTTFGKMVAPLLIKMPKEACTEAPVSETP
jgi:succinate-acetate transporter protein